MLKFWVRLVEWIDDVSITGRLCEVRLVFTNKPMAQAVKDAMIRDVTQEWEAAGQGKAFNMISLFGVRVRFLHKAVIDVEEELK